MSKGLSNYQIDYFFKDEENEDFQKNDMGTYSIDSIPRYIIFYEIIKRRNAKYPFSIFNVDKKMNQAFTGGVSSIFNQKTIYFYLTHLV